MLHDQNLEFSSASAQMMRTGSPDAMSATAMDQTHTLISRIARSVSLYPGRPAVLACGETLTYDEFWKEAGAIARGLLQAGVQPRDRVAILSARSVTAYTAILAALRAGCTYVPLNPRYPVARNRAILSASEATALIIDKSSAARFSDLLDESLVNLRLVVLPEPKTDLKSSGLDVIDRGDLHNKDDGFEWPKLNPDDLAYLLFTSGSTGAPKGVPIRHRSVCDYVGAISTLSPIVPDDRLIQLVDLTFDLSAHDMFLSWSNGASIVSVPENATLIAPRFVQNHRVTCWMSVPSAVGLGHQAGLLEPNVLPSLRLSYFCGEALPRSVAEIWSSAAPNSKIYNLYGPTEATIAFSYYHYDSGEDGPATIPIGRPLQGQDMAVFDEAGRKLGLGGIGEIHLAGSQLSPGYWRAPHLDTERFIPREGRRWYRTGDLGRLESDGYHYLGRIDRQTKIRGYRVELLEVEGALRSASGREVVAVVPWPKLSEGIAEGIVAFITGGVMDEGDVRAQMSGLLPDYMVPSRILHLDEMPLNVNNKVDYKALEALLSSEDGRKESPSSRRTVAPSRPIHAGKPAGGQVQKLIDSWATLFPDKTVSAESSFLTLEGDSLTYVSALIETERVLGSVPDNWTALSLQDLASQKVTKQSTWLSDLDTASLLRFFAILLVVAAHLDLMRGAGETSALILVSGFFFGRLQLDEFQRKLSVAPLFRFVSRILLPYYAVFLAILPLTWKANFPVGVMLDMLLLQDIIPSSWTGGNASYLWYVHALVHIILFFGAVVALSIILQRKLGIHFNVEAILLITLGIGFTFRFLVPAVMDPSFFEARLSDNALPRYLFLSQLFTFSAGAAIGLGSPRLFYVGLAMAAVNAILSWVPYDAVESVAILLSAFALAFVPKVRTLKFLQQPVYVIANASLFIYLIHMPVKWVLLKLGVPVWGVFALALVAGVLAWHIWTFIQHKFAAHTSVRYTGTISDDP